MTFFEIAAPMAQLGEPQIRVRPATKVAMDSDWPKLATTDLEVLKKWNSETPNASAASVAKAEPGGFWFWEVDHASAIQRMESETGRSFDHVFRVRSSPGKGHFHFKQSIKSIQMGNLAQGFVKGGDWSARVDNQYVISPGSLHVRTGKPYEIIDCSQITEAPEWLIEWLLSQKIEKKSVEILQPDAFIIEGKRNSSLASIAGRWRAVGLSEEAIMLDLMKVNDRCVPPLPSSEVEQIVRSICRYPAGALPQAVQIDSQPSGAAVQRAFTPRQELQIEEDEAPEIKGIAYPKFPRWIMEGTSIYKGLVKPYCDLNSRYEEFMFMPALSLMLNYVGMKVRIKNHYFIPSIYLILIGRRGQTLKSASVNSAFDYFEYAGMLGQATSATSNADGRVLVWTAGSPEGFALDMARKSCKHAVLSYDELSRLVSKASIESSTMNSAILEMYESMKLANTIKNQKESYSIEANTYVVSLFACTTDKNFRENWSRMAGDSSGMNDRFFFLYQPQTLKEQTIKVDVNTCEGALETRKLVDKAMDKGVYDIDECNLPALQSVFKNYSNREAIRALKFALYFTIDLGLEEVTGSAIERAVALIDYEASVKKYLRIDDSDALTREANIQLELKFQLGQSNGTIKERDLYRAIGQKYGESIWQTAIRSLRESGDIRISGSGKRGSPKIITLMRPLDEEE